MTLLSIIVPCYNQSHYLEKCIHSVSTQSFRSLELIIVNDGSTDLTEDVVLKWQRIDTRIRYLKKENGGLSSARNAGIKLAIGKYLLFLDADDWMENESLKDLNFKEEHSLIHFGYNYYLDFENYPIKSVYPRKIEKLYPSILSGNLWPVHSCIVKKEIVLQAGCFDEQLVSVEDWDFWIRISKFDVMVSVCNTICVAYRLTNSSMSKDPIKMYNSVKYVFQRGLKVDKRLPKALSLNKDNAYICVSDILKKHLLVYVGLSIAKGDIDQAITLYYTEISKLNCRVFPQDFTNMCSYLTFRYRENKNDLEWIFNELKPNFSNFLKRLNKPKKYVKLSEYYIFKYAIMQKNSYKYGLLSPMINRFQLLFHSISVVHLK